MKRPTIQRGLEKQVVDGASFRLIDEVRYVQGLAAEHALRIVTLPQLLLFSTETGDAWLLEPSDQLATPLARDGDPLPVHIEETDKNFTIGWSGQYRIDGRVFIYQEKGSGRVRTILGYPTRKITQHAGS